MNYQRVTDPGYNTGKVRIGSAAPTHPRRMNEDELFIQSVLLGRPKRRSFVERLADFVLSFTR